MVEIDDSPRAPSIIVAPIDTVTGADFAEDRPEVASEPNDEDEALAPKPPEPAVDREREDAAAVEAASQPLPNVEPVADAVEANTPQSEQLDLAESHREPIIMLAPQKDRETGLTGDLQVNGPAKAHFGAQNNVKNTLVTLHPARAKADGLRNDLAPEPVSEAPTGQQSVAASIPPNKHDDERKVLQKVRPAFAAPALVATLVAVAIGFYLNNHGVKRPDVDPANQAWSKIATSRDPRTFEDYARKYPGSPHLDMAIQTAARLEEEQLLADRKRVEQLAASRRNPENTDAPVAPPDQSHSGPVNPPSGGNVDAGSATPSEVAREVIEALKAERMAARGWIGLQMQPVTPEVAESLGLKSTNGALVAVAQPDAPATRAGIVSGDVITNVNGEPIERPRDLARKIAAMGPNVSIDLGYIHDGAEKIVTFKLGRLLDNKKTETAPPSQPSAMTALTGFGLSLATAATLAGGGKEGAVVTEIDPVGPAARKGLRSGDVILEAGGKPVSSPEDVIKALDDARREGLRPVLLRVKSGDTTRFLTLTSDAS